jgi:hypothetical protein
VGSATTTEAIRRAIQHRQESLRALARRGDQVVARRNTLIALDGTTEIRMACDNCLLVMPGLSTSRGHTAVRLARLRSN